MKRTCILVTAVLLLLATVSPAWAAGGRKLADQELDQVTAGDFNIQFLDGALKFAFDSGTKLANQVSGDGTLSFNTQSIPGTVGNVVMGPGAQQDLQSLINIIAVNSIVNCLLNLNINVNSHDITVNQQNLTLH